MLISSQAQQIERKRNMVKTTGAISSVENANFRHDIFYKKVTITLYLRKPNEYGKS
jgi:hypothetical protein